MRFKRKRIHPTVEYDEILLDASNLPSFNAGRMEGKLELPIPRRNVYVVGLLFCVVALAFMTKLFQLQWLEGEAYAAIGEDNRVSQRVVIAERGVIYDRNGELLVWNEPDDTSRHNFPVRAYTDRPGLGQLLGYVSYPQRDRNGFYYRVEYVGRDGVEEAYDTVLQGENGLEIVEVDALGGTVAQHEVDPPHSGSEFTLSIDAELTQAMYDIIATSSAQAGFRSGAGAIMDVRTGELLALTSFPSYDPEVMADGINTDLIASYANDGRFPFLNKVIGGEYTPGSVVKPFVAYAALEENIIDPEKIIVSTGEIIIPNPYSPSNPARFTDWRAHGKMTMKEAIAFSSNVYFYYISGGYGDQEGLGIVKMNEYFDLFKFGTTTGIALGNEQAGTVPSPDWKQAVFGEAWRLGDTYNTSIGQFGWQVTPLQLLRAYGALANGGKFFTPHVEQGQMGQFEYTPLNEESLAIVREGMRMTTYYPGGTARGLERSDVAIAAKSGTAEVGAGNAYVNSWAAGYWPYEDPQYAFILMMDRAPRSNSLGATTIMGKVVEWMSEHRPEYLGITAEEASTD